MTTQEPDPRTAPDDNEDATNHGESAVEPVEGNEEAAPKTDGSPQD